MTPTKNSSLYKSAKHWLGGIETPYDLCIGLGCICLLMLIMFKESWGEVFNMICYFIILTLPVLVLYILVVRWCPCL